MTSGLATCYFVTKLSETVDRGMVVIECHVSFRSELLRDTNKLPSPIGSGEVMQSNQTLTRVYFNRSDSLNNISLSAVCALACQAYSGFHDADSLKRSQAAGLVRQCPVRKHKSPATNAHLLNATPGWESTCPLPRVCVLIVNHDQLDGCVAGEAR